MSLSKILLLVLGSLLLFVASSAQASMRIEVRLARIDGTLLSVVPAATKNALGYPSAKYMSPSSLDALMAHQYQFDVYASVFGTDSDSTNDGVQSLWGNIATSGGSIVVTPAGSKLAADASVTGVGVNPFHGSGSKNGKVQPWGMGSLPSTVADDYVILRAAGMQTWDWAEDPGTGELTVAAPEWRGNGAPGAGIETKIGSFKVRVTSFAGYTTIGWRFAMAPDGSKWNQGALWLEDGTSRDASSAQLVSTSFIIDVPEPAGLSLLAIAGLQLLLRRRR